MTAFDSRGFTPLHTAAARGSTELLRVLAQKTTNTEIPCRDGTEDTSLILAARRGQARSVEILLDNGAQIDNRNNGGYTALMSAAYECHTEAVAILLSKGANPTATTPAASAAPRSCSQAGASISASRP